ncbi:MAG TPA: sigma-70 family RNA polymerase sigma factor, partial [Acidimicrobiales bacterium]|nr:sigma-70 family RNA polymerase sigma factor [Acidimicrobiales bacterium]
MKSMDLAGVVLRARNGDPDAWAILVERFQDRALATALGWSGQWSEAADIAQEAFRLAYLHLDQLADPTAFGPWFARLVRTACHRSWRSVRPDLLDWEAGRSLVDPGTADPAQLVAASEETEGVRTAIETLPPSERMVIALHYLAEMSYPEIADFLGIG